MILEIMRAWKIRSSACSDIVAKRCVLEQIGLDCAVLYVPANQWLHSAGTGRNGVPPPVSGVPPPEIAVPPPKVVVPPPGNDVPSPFWGKSLKLLPAEVRF